MAGLASLSPFGYHIRNMYWKGKEIVDMWGESLMLHQLPGVLCQYLVATLISHDPVNCILIPLNDLIPSTMLLKLDVLEKFKRSSPFMW